MLTIMSDLARTRHRHQGGYMTVSLLRSTSFLALAVVGGDPALVQQPTSAIPPAWRRLRVRVHRRRLLHQRLLCCRDDGTVDLPARLLADQCQLQVGQLGRSVFSRARRAQPEQQILSAVRRRSDGGTSVPLTIGEQRGVVARGRAASILQVLEVQMPRGEA